MRISDWSDVVSSDLPTSPTWSAPGPPHRLPPRRLRDRDREPVFGDGADVAVLPHVPGGPVHPPRPALQQDLERGGRAELSVPAEHRDAPATADHRAPRPPRLAERHLPSLHGGRPHPRPPP